MLTRDQADGIWRKMVEAEVRSLYFGELSNQYSRRQRWILSLSFLLSSGAGITALGQATSVWVPGLLALAAAALIAYSIEFSLVDQTAEMAKLHSSWNRLADDYERLWHRWYEDDAERILGERQHRAAELSEAGMKAPYKRDRVEYWGKHVYSSYTHSESAPGAA